MRNPVGQTVAVIMPTHNRAHLVGRAIESVLAQTHTDWRLVVVDDASRDSTDDVVAGFADQRIQYIRNPQALGASGARNVGIRGAGPSDYLAFLDDDDEWLPRKLELQLQKFRTSDPELTVVGCGRLDYDENGVVEARIPMYRGQLFEHLLARRARGYGVQLILVRRNPGEEDVLFDVQMRCLEDLDYSIRHALRGPFDFVPEALVRVRRDDGGPHLWNAEAAIVGYRQLAAKYAQALTTRPWIESYYQVCIARDLARLGRMAECRENLRQALAGSSSRLRLGLWYAASMVGAAGIKACVRFFPILPPELA
jgi:glycosyltransferase involved in cell wall biosynthesis